MRATDYIVHQNGEYFVLRNPKKGFDVYRNGTTASHLVSQCGYEGQKGLDWCKSDIIRRIEATDGVCNGKGN